MSMSIDRLEGILRQEMLADSRMRERGIKEIVDEFNYKDAEVEQLKAQRDIFAARLEELAVLNTQLLEACKAYIINPQSPMVHDQIEAAIRAVEEEK